MLNNLMKNKIVFIILTICLSFLFLQTSFAREETNEWYIKDFSTEIIVNLDSSLDITEVIVADCGYLDDKHGIFRILPTDYKTNEGNFILPIKLESITDENGNNYKYSKEKNDDTITFKIGDKNIEVKGENTYIIKYRVENAVRTERNSYDELYWNVLGNFWDMEIDNFRAKIIFPEEINKNNTDIDYYAGALGSKDKGDFDLIWLDENIIELRKESTIYKNKGLTLSASFPKDIVTPYKYSIWQRIKIAINNSALKYIISGILVFLVFLFWLKKGRDPEINKPLIAEYEIPEGLTPIEAGLILTRGRQNKSTIPATIINLAVKGYLKIEKIEKRGIFFKEDYRFINQHKETDLLYLGEKELFEKLFSNNKSEVKLSDLKNSNQVKVAQIYKHVKNDLKARKIIDKNSANIGLGMIIIGCIFNGIVFESDINIIFSLVGFSLVIFGFLMNKLTKEGSELKHKIKGFKLFMKTVEKHRASFYEKEGIMEKFLPYAILFGITKQWLKSMKNIFGEEYLNNYQSTFLVGAITISDLDNFESLIGDISSNISSTVSSSSTGVSGSGFSGGGSGGGGGGGW